MPVTPTYPGVYIEEIPSGVRTITGVATSITAFIGRAKRGPVDEAKTINSFGDFETIFGGLDLKSSMSFAVRDFYLNGGSQAVIVRLYNEETGDGTSPPKTPLTLDGLSLEAANQGSWGANLRATIDLDVSEEVAIRHGLEKSQLFNLTIRDVVAGGSTERFLNLTVDEDSERRVDKVLEAQSKLIHWKGDWPGTQPEMPKIKVVQDKEKDLAEKEKALADQLAEDPEADNVPALRTAVENAKKALSDAGKDLDDPVTKAEKTLKEAKESDPDGDHSALITAVDNAKKLLKASDGSPLDQSVFTGPGLEGQKKGLFALEHVDLFNLLCLPPYLASHDVDKSLIAKAVSYCEKRRAMLLVDSPSSWTDKDKAKAGISTGVGAISKNAAIYFPRLKQPNPLRENRIEEFVPCGAVAGIMARTDTQRGVWKAPAGIEATLRGVPELTGKLTDPENGELNPLGVNCLRSFPIIGRVVWGSRTLRGADVLADEYKYVPVRRLALFIEESLFRGTQWVVFEPNDEPLWAQIRLNVGAFMNNLFRQGAFQGTNSREAYFVKCDKETTPQNDIDRGIVNIVVGFAPLKPAEFVIIKLQQIAGEIEV